MVVALAEVAVSAGALVPAMAGEEDMATKEALTLIPLPEDGMVQHLMAAPMG
jgi:hypothetical protein